MILLMTCPTDEQAGMDGQMDRQMHGWMDDGVIDGWSIDR